MTDVTFFLDGETGNLILETSDRFPRELLREVTDLIGLGRVLGCAKPLDLLPPPPVAVSGLAEAVSVRVHGYYHNSLIEGPGRRSCVLLSGCDLGRRGCWVPHLHPISSGSLVPVDQLADALLDSRYQRDGVSIAGGEPFLQPAGLLTLVCALREGACPHILVYTGHRYEDLLARARLEPEVGAVLDSIDMLIDGPYIEALASSAGPWTGSGNRRVLDMAAMHPPPGASRPSGCQAT